MPIPIGGGGGGGGTGGGTVDIVDTGTPTWTVYGDKTTASPIWTAGVLDDFGAHWIVTSEEGWSSAPGVRLTDTDRPNSDGDFRGSSSYTARTIVLTGTCLAPNRIGMLEAKERLHSVADDPNGEYLLVVTEAHLTRQTIVYRADAIKMDDSRAGGDRAFDFQITLKAADPARYALAEQLATAVLQVPPSGRAYPRAYPLDFGTPGTGGSTTITNAGPRRTPARLRINGPVSNPQVENLTSGDVFGLDLDLAAGDYVDVDTFAGLVLLNGTASRTSRLSTGTGFIWIVPGSNTLTFHSDSYDASALLTVACRSAWG